MDQYDRRRLLIAAAVAALLTAPAAVRILEDSPARPVGALAPVSPRLVLTPCDQVEAPPSDVERDTWYDPRTGVVQVWFRVGAADRHFAIDPRNDLTCAQYPEIRALIEHVQGAATHG